MPPKQTKETFAICVMANPAVEPLKDALITDIQKRLRRISDALKVDWLAEREACDIIMSTEEHTALKIELRALLEGRPFDGAILPAKGRRKKLLLSDMDSTVIQQECLDELADFAGFKAEVSAITEAAMRGELDFKDALAKRVALLKGMNVDKLQRTFDERITVMPGAGVLVATMKAHGAKAILVSGGFTFFTERVAKFVGFDGQLANVLGIDGDTLTGLVEPPILDKDSKLLTLTKVAESLKLPLSDTLAVGDGANDLPMIEAAGLGVAYHGKEIVRKGADAAIDHGDLTALLYLQGYHKKDFVAG